MHRYLSAALAVKLRAADSWCRDKCVKPPKPEDGMCECCKIFGEACDEAEREATARVAKRDRDEVADRTAVLLPMMTRGERARAEIAAAEGDGEPPSKRGTGELVADHVKYWPLFRMWVCQWCNVHFTWIFDTFPDARVKFKKAVKMAFISLAGMNSAV